MSWINEDDLLVKKELIHLASSNTLASSIAFFIAVITIVIAFWHTTNQTFLIIWSCLITVFLILRTILAKSFLKDSSKVPLDIIEKRFNLYIIIYIIIFTIGLLVIVPKNMPFHQAFLSMIIAGLASGSVMSLSVFNNLIRNYLIILIVPFTFIIYIQNTQLHTLITILMILFLILLMIFSRRYHTDLINVIKSKILIEDAKKELKKSQNHFSTIFEQAPVGIFTYNNELIIQELNQELVSILDVEYEKLKHLDMKTLPDQVILPALSSALKGKKGFYEGTYHTKISDKDIWISMQTVPIYDKDENIEGGLAITADITQRVMSEQKIRHQAFCDSLTGLGNRITFNKCLEQQIENLSRHHRFGAVLFIDFDHFKTINDSLGHHIGDTILKIFATRVSSIVRKEDAFARLGGDEFVILLSELSDNEMQATRLAYQIAENLHTLMKKPIEVEEHTLHITISIGVILIGSKETNINNILKNADIAMYEAKSAGRNTTRFFEKEMSHKIEKQLILNNELREAIKHDQFELYYQPIVDTKSSKIITCEALIRWNHPTRGLIFPDSFIPYAEDCGLIIFIGEWVIQRACIDYKKLNLKTIAINISSKQFNQENFVKNILKTTKDYSVHPSSFKLELTESAAIDNFSATIKKMNILKSYGFSIAMDDFGTGYSSLSYLKNLPFDFLKIDRSFIQNILNNKDDASLVKTILNISKQFKFAVIAEGVETQEHVNFLKEHQCEYYQGYVISKAIPLEQFKKLLTEVS
nr:EAL domain-containing protein [uncultured Sulfurimonas sp.]